MFCRCYLDDLLIVANMSQPFCKKIDDMLVIQGVKNHFAFFAVFDQAQVTQNPQLMGDR